MNELLQELQGTVCRCGRNKQARQTFCGGCYRALPRAMQLALYRRFGSGYEEAYAAAVAELKGDDPHVAA
jgi:hypothetical protein